MNEFHIKMSATTVIIITLPYFMNQNNAQKSQLLQPPSQPKQIYC